MQVLELVLMLSLVGGLAVVRLTLWPAVVSSPLLTREPQSSAHTVACFTISLTMRGMLLLSSSTRYLQLYVFTATC